MNYIKIPYDQAIDLQEAGQIILLDISHGQLSAVQNQYGQLWKDNFSQLLLQVPHVAPDKILPFFSAKYVTEIVESIPHGEHYQYAWRFLYGIPNGHIQSKITNRCEYVYILVNPGYPDLVKIGMTTDTVSARVTAINATGTVHEWVAKYAIQVSRGSAYGIEQQVHKALAYARVSSDVGNSREFFSVDVLSALDKVREIGCLHMIGQVIVY
jgi:hypothetical protein